MPAVPGCPAVASGGRGSTGPGVLLPWSWRRSGWSAGRDGLKAGDGGGDVGGPGPVFGEAQAEPATAPGEPSGDGEQAQAEPFRFPAAGGPGQGEQLRPGQQFAGQGHDLAPDLVLGEALEGEVAQPGVLGVADAVLAAGAAAVPQFQVRELAFSRVGGEGGEPVPVNRSCAPGWGRSLRTMTRIPAGQDDKSSIAVMSATQAPSLSCPSPS